MEILTEKQILQKTKRLAIELLEHNYNEEKLYLIGVNNNGAKFADMLVTELKRITAIKIIQSHIRLSPANPIDSPINLKIDKNELLGQTVVVVDDVANSGRTLFYACKPLLDTLPKKLETVVLVDRTHKSFPIKVDYVGMSLATTLLEDIDVRIRNVEEMSVHLV
ncbi:MAG: phosphoribosyltransferase family protein [Bacteroidota bacterium]